MDTPQYEQQVLYYTQAEVDAKVAEALNNALIKEQQSNRSLLASLEYKALDWFKSEVRNGSMTKEDALGIFNGLADALGWDTVDTIASTYLVTVTINDLEIGTFDGVEADDEDDAVAQVLENLDAEATFEVSFNGQTITETYHGGWDMDINATAVEED